MPLLLILLAAAMLTTVASASEVPTDPARFDLYLLVGQSNMAGRGLVEEADRQPVPRLLIFDRKETWAWKGEPVHFDKAQAGVGLGFTFGKLMAEQNPEVTIGLIPCAVGGTPIERWMPGADLYESAVNRTRLAMEKGDLKGILWHQGEGASGDAGQTAGYVENLSAIIAGFRHEFNDHDLPFVAGQLGEFLYTRPKNPFSREFNERLLLLPKTVPYTAVVSSKDLKDNGDQLHFDASSLKELGKRYYEAYVGLVKK